MKPGSGMFSGDVLGMSVPGLNPNPVPLNGRPLISTPCVAPDMALDWKPSTAITRAT